MYRFRRVQHRRRRQHTSESDHDGSESEECIDLSSSPSNDHLGSASSDSESDNEDSIPGAWKTRSLKNDDDSDNDSTSSSNDSDSDSDGDGVNTKENQSGAAISRSIRNHSQFKYNDDGKESLQEPSASSHDTNGPLSPWTKSNSKARIIDDLKNNNSSIHALVGSDWEANLDELWKQYAPRYQRSKFKGYMKTIMDNYSAKKGAFKEGFVAVNSSDSPSLTSWEKSNSRKRIISDLRDYRSTIHALVKDWEFMTVSTFATTCALLSPNFIFSLRKACIIR